MTEALSLTYFGPTSKRLGLSHGMCYALPLPPQVEALIGQQPGFRALFVNFDDYARVNHELKNPNSASSQIYKHFSK